MPGLRPRAFMNALMLDLADRQVMDPSLSPLAPAFARKLPTPQLLFRF